MPQMRWKMRLRLFLFCPPGLEWSSFGQLFCRKDFFDLRPKLRVPPEQGYKLGLLRCERLVFFMYAIHAYDSLRRPFYFAKAEDVAYWENITRNVRKPVGK